MGESKTLRLAKGPEWSSSWWQPTRGEAALLLVIDAATVLAGAWVAVMLWGGRWSLGPLFVLAGAALAFGAFDMHVRNRCRREGVLGHGNVRLRHFSPQTEPRCARALGLPRALGTALIVCFYAVQVAVVAGGLVFLVR